MLRRCLLLMVGSSLLAHCSQAFCSNQPAEIPAANTSTEQSSPVATLTKRPVTVADSIQMTRLGDPIYTEGAPSKGITAKYSPDGKQFVVLLKKGNLENNTNEYSLLLFQTATVFQSPEPRVLVSLASSSNRPAIDSVRWLDDNDTLVFLGERPGEPMQPYLLKTSSNELTKLMSQATNLDSFITTANGKLVAYTQSPVSSYLTESAARNGIAVTNEWLSDLIRGNHGGNDYDDHTLWVMRSGKGSDTKMQIQGRIWRDSPMSLSPDGAHLLIQTEPAYFPAAWSEYDDQFLKQAMRSPAPKGGGSGIQHYELVDTVTGASTVLFDAPIASSESEMAWSPDSKSVVVSHVFLPLNVDNLAEQKLRKAHSFLVEFKVPSREFVKISDEDLRLLNWEPKTGAVVCDVGRFDSFTGKTTPKAYFRNSGENWSRTDAPAQTLLPEIVLDEDIKTPPHMVAIDPLTGRKSPLMDLNPQFQNLTLARVEEVTWKDSRGNEVKGGLYWPPEYVAGKKYPLILQTHGWVPYKFWMDGPWPTGFAAQPLAGKGFFVLQISDPDWHIWDTTKEVPTAMAAYEGAIDYLDRRGLIDRNRVGITGFSRTCWYVTYMLTHSKHHIAAAGISDGVDFSYFQYMAVPSTAPGFEQMFGGPPFGKSLPTWLKQSPAFLMDRVEAPLRIQTLGSISMFTGWHWYSGLSRLDKPVELIYIPDGTHILEKPWDRMVSQQGNVDWFCFWLKGEEDPDPAKAEQYKRWRELRKLQKKSQGSTTSDR